MHKSYNGYKRVRRTPGTFTQAGPVTIRKSDGSVEVLPALTQHELRLRTGKPLGR
jgi:hypothetical protein